MSAYHVNCCICQVDEGRYDLGFAVRLLWVDVVKLARIPQGQDGAGELGETLLPNTIWRGAAACS